MQILFGSSFLKENKKSEGFFQFNCKQKQNKERRKDMILPKQSKVLVVLSQITAGGGLSIV
jgi:hypothetical protein